MTRRTVWSMIGILVLAGRLSAAEEDGLSFEEAQGLEKSGKLDEAFLAYLKIPGAQHMAARMARIKAEGYLKLVRAHAEELPPMAARLLEGDLLLARGKKDEALACYRAVASAFRSDTMDDRDARIVSREEYFVEPPAATPDRPSPNRPVAPFSVGPGSHRDNWLVRRFIAADAMDDAAAELARIWEIHRRNTRPFLVDVAIRYEDEKPVYERRLARRAGFDGRGLQFALDYAFFLKRNGKLESVLAVLREPLGATDMDRNPNSTVYEPVGQGDEDRYPLRNDMGSRGFIRYSWHSAGVSRKEYVRLTYGVFKEAGKEDALVEMLQKEIADGENRLRRVLARIRFHQGRADDALALELAYIEQAGLDKISTACRRGQTYESAGKPAEAAQAYEQVLALPFTPPKLPDADEEAVQSSMMRQSAMVAPGPHMPAGRAYFQADILRRLGRLYGALGKPDKAFEVSLREFEVNPALLQHLKSLEQAQARAEALGRQEQFDKWLRDQVDTADPTARAHVCWLLEDHAGCGRALGEAWKAAKGSYTYSYEPWRDRFRQVGKEQLRAFLTELLEADPENARARLDLLDLEDDFEGPEAIAALESLLETDASFAFARFKAARNRTRFRNYFDLAYRLMRLYEKHDQSEKLVALGLRVFEGEKPFTRSEKLVPLPTPRANWHGRSELADVLDCLYVMLAHATKPDDMKRIGSLVDASDCIPLKNQWARLLPERRDRRIDPSEIHRRKVGRVVLETPGVPEDVRLLSHRDDVRSISPDGRWVGSSWGLVRYGTLENNGLEILQIPVGVRVTTFCETPRGLFVGTRGGLYRLDEPDGKQPSLVRIDLESVRRTAGTDRERAVHTQQLLWWEDALWVRDGDGLFRYEPEQQAARYYGRVPGRLFAAHGTLWTGRQVLDRATDEFRLIQAEGKYWSLIGSTEKEIWADVYVDDQLRHRPALVDPKTLDVHVLPLENAKPGEKLMVNGEFKILSEDDGHVWLMGAQSLLTVYDRATGKLRKVTPTHEGATNPDVPNLDPVVGRAYSDGSYFYSGSGTRKDIPGLNLDGDRGPYFCWRELDGDRLLLGSGIVRQWREDNLGHDDNTGMSHHIQDLEGGLFEIDTNTFAWNKLGSRANELTDFYVKKICFDDRDRRAYVCTNGGVTILSLPDCKPAGRITVSDGLPSNKVEDLVRIGQKLYFACELGDEDGGLAVQDLDTKLLQRLSMADGLKSNKIKALRAEGTKLHILYGTLYGVRAHNTLTDDSEQAEGGDSRVRTFRSSILDTVTGKLAEGDEVLPASQAPDASNRLPYLGGAVLCDVTHGKKRFIGGTHGLVIINAGTSVAAGLPFSAEAVKPLLSLGQIQLAEAAKIQVPRAIPLADLKRLLDHDNPFVKANALAAAMRPVVTDGNAEYTPLIGRCVSDPCERVRSTAVWLLGKAKDDAAIRPLQTALKDRDSHIRAVAAMGLARHGELPPLAHFGEMLKYEDHYSNYPYGATSSIGVEVSHERVFAALAPHADRRVFELLLKYPINADDYEPRQKVFVALGASLREHPEVADLLLVTYTRPNDPGTGVARFAQEVFKHAGEAMLPILHKALQSPDRVIRSNAARACGSIGDESSIKPLIAALDLESGFSRASIVWALGELKAPDALPHLATLYVDARNDEKRQRGSGFRMAQAAAQVQSQFENIRNLESIGTDWDELKQTTVAEPIDPRRHERLLSPRMILDAVAKIGPAASQTFYRRLAAEADTEARREAAVRLAEGSDDGRARNLPILRNLLGDSDTSVRAASAVSLLLLGEKDVQKQIVAWLKSADRGEQHTTLDQLGRVEDGRSLIFAREALQELAGRVRVSWYDDERLQRLLERIPGG